MITSVSVDEIQPNPHQPRLYFDQEGLVSLADSIRKHGLNQPVLVRRVGNGYELVAGERRLRASKLAGLSQIPSIVKSFTDEESFQFSLVENLQREDLSSLEEAESYKKLIDHFDMTHDSVSKLVGKSRSYITNCLRLLLLPEIVKIALLKRELSEGHARALLGVQAPDKIIELFETVLSSNLTVRQTEELVNKSKKPAQSTRAASESQLGLFVDFEKRLSDRLTTAVKISGSPSKGKIVINYSSPSALEKLLSTLLVD